MPPESSRVWTDLYYKIVEYYFWKPQTIGRISSGKGASWDSWRKQLEKGEEPLNHILDLFFHIAPQAMLDAVISDLVGRCCSHLYLLDPKRAGVHLNTVQPDITVASDTELVFIEMKVTSLSSIDQFVKYAIAAHQIQAKAPGLKATDLVMLTPHVEHGAVWADAKKLGLVDAASVRAVAMSGLDGAPGIWRQKGVPAYLARRPHSRDAIRQIVQSMRLTLVDYGMLARALRAYGGAEPTVRHLVDGVVHELERRQL